VVEKPLSLYQNFYSNKYRNINMAAHTYTHIHTHTFESYRKVYWTIERCIYIDDMNTRTGKSIVYL
jgi:hypothetical protein